MVRPSACPDVVARHARCGKASAPAQDILPRSRGADSARALQAGVPRRNKGAGKAGCPMHPQPRTQNKKRTSVVTTGSPKQSGLPCAMVLTAYSALSSATNSSCHRRPRIKADQPGRADFASVDLAPATGVRTTRFCRPRPPFEKAARRIWHQSAEALAKADQRRSSCAL